MKKIRILVASIAVLATAGTAFAFSAKGSGNTFIKNSSNQCVPDPNCSSGSGATECTSVHFSDAGCTTQLQPSNTHTVVD
jgi:hypothetical protein